MYPKEKALSFTHALLVQAELALSVSEALPSLVHYLSESDGNIRRR
jgi:hypothetical protein